MADNATGAPGTVNWHAASYDALDHPTSLDGGSNGYTADGLLGWTQAPGASSPTYFVYDGDTPVGEIDGGGTVKATNLFGPAGLVHRSDSSGNRFYLFDTQGNTAERLDDSGNVLDTHAFDAYGQELTTPATGDPYAGFGAQFGYRTDGTTGLDLLGHRFYDPVTARFVTSDPIGLFGGLNAYRYAGNNPFSFVDPLGFCADDPNYLKEQLGLGAAGFIPGAGELANGAGFGLALSHHDVWGAVLSGFAMVPIIGEAADGAKEARLATELAEVAAKADEEATPLLKVIGRQVDTSVAKDWEGHSVLNDPNWTLEKNDAWIQEGIDSGQQFYLASEPTLANLRNAPGSKYATTVFYRELTQLRAAGYGRVGDYMVPGF